MEKIRGPVIFLAQFIRDEEPCNSIETTDMVFDDFVGGQSDMGKNREIFGL